MNLTPFSAHITIKSSFIKCYSPPSTPSHPNPSAEYYLLVDENQELLEQNCDNFWLNLFSKVFTFVLLHSGTFYLQTEKPPDGEEQDQSPRLAGCGGQQQLQGRKTCSSKCCKVEADTFLSKMNQTIDPCDDFYQFACGKWIEETKLTNVTFGPIKKKLNEQVRSIVLGISSSTS